MARHKRVAKATKAPRETSAKGNPNIPSESCKKFLIEVTIKFFEAESTRSMLDTKKSLHINSRKK